jgi:hypothetical protein
MMPFIILVLLLLKTESLIPGVDLSAIFLFIVVISMIIFNLNTLFNDYYNEMITSWKTNITKKLVADENRLKALLNKLQLK